MSSHLEIAGLIGRVAAIVAVPLLIFSREQFALWCAAGVIAVVGLLSTLTFVRDGDSDSSTVQRGLLTGLNLAVFLAFLANHWINPTSFIVLYLSELIVPYLRVFARQSGNPLSPRWSERLKLAVHTLMQLALLTLVASGADIGVIAIELCVVASVICVLDHGVATARRLMPARDA